MKKRKFSDYKNIIFPPGLFVPGRSAVLRKAGWHIGFLGFYVIIVVLLYLAMACFEGIHFLNICNELLVFYALLMSVSVEWNEAGKYRPYSLQNRFYCMMPYKERILKKAFISHEVHVFVFFVLSSATGEILGFAGGDHIRGDRAVFGCMAFYTMSCAIRYLIRMRKKLLFYISCVFGFVVVNIFMIGFGRMDYEWAGDPFWYKWWTCLLVSVLAVISGVFLTNRTYQFMIIPGRRNI